MKQFFSYLGASLAAIAALASCNKEIDAPVENLKGGVPFEICASTAETKTAMNDDLTSSWVADDAINLFHAEAGTATYTSDGKFTISAENLSANKFKGTLAGELTAESYDWYAFYPYSSYNLTPAGSSKSDFGYTTIGGTAQTQTGNNSTAHLAGKPCPLYGVVKSVASNVAPTVEMNHLTSIIEVNVTNNSGKDLTVTDVAFTGSEDIVGTYYINFAGTPVVYAGSGVDYVSNTASLTVESGEAIANGSSAKFYIAVKPFTATAEQTLSLSVNGYSKDITHSGDVTFTAGKIKKIKFNYDKTTVDNTVTFDFSNPESLGITKPSSGQATNITSDIVKEDVTISTTDGSYATRVWNSSGTCDLRVYSSGGSLTFSVPEGTVITKIVFTGTAFSAITPSVGTINNGTWTGSNQSVKLTATSTLKISTATVTYSLGKAKTSIIADDITNISARGESAGELTYSIENPIDGTVISATCDGTVVTDVIDNEGSFLYEVSTNTTTSTREGSITLTYGDVTKVVKVSQMAPVFKVSRTEVELEAAAGSSSTITVTSDFDWKANASTGAGFTSTPTTCEWNSENPYTDGKTTVTITAPAENASVEGAKSLGTLTFTNDETGQTLEVSVTQKTSYVAPILGNIATGTLTSGKEGLTLEEGKAITYSEIKKGPNYGEYTNPARFYASNEFVVSSSAGNITKITITCSSTSYATMLETTMTNAKLGTVTKSSNDVSLELTTPATTVTLTNSGQWRASTMTVEYE
ncbi:MAG: hypothetical protein ACI3Y4_00965 [Candidatus Cryptobacteroides sp.]